MKMHGEILKEIRNWVEVVCRFLFCLSCITLLLILIRIFFSYNWNIQDHMQT